MLSKFVGDENPKETAKKTLAAYNLSKVAKVAVLRLGE